MCRAFFDRHARVDRNVEFGPDKLEVVVQPDSCDHGLVLWSDEQGECLRKSFACDLRGRVD